MKPYIPIGISEAKANLSKLVEEAAKGEPFIIAKRGKPLVRVSAISTSNARRRVGFMKGQFKVPADFDRLGKSEIEDIFPTE